MLAQLEGSRAVATAVARCRPDVVAAYPISPQTHIVEALAADHADGVLGSAAFLHVESELAALSACIGAAATGARAYTATAGQGLLFMAEAVFNAGGLGLPLVMTVANRAIGAPINIWNDHSDAVALRDAGWVQLHAGSVQDAVDLHVQAFALAEELSLPVMVCLDGYVLTHATERVDVPDAPDVDAWRPPVTPRVVLDPDDPVTIGALVGPDAFTEVRVLADRRLRAALDLVPDVAARFAARFGRDTGGLLRAYRCDDAATVVVTIGSAFGTVQEVVDELREEGAPVGALHVTCFRPVPVAALQAALAGAERVVVLDRAVSPGAGGVLGRDVAAAVPRLPVHDVVAGLGGRPVARASLRGLLRDALAGRLGDLTFLDARSDVLEVA